MITWPPPPLHAVERMSGYRAQWRGTFAWRLYRAHAAYMRHIDHLAAEAHEERRAAVEKALNSEE